MCRIAKVHNQPGFRTPLVDWRSLTFGEYERPEVTGLRPFDARKCRTLAEYQAAFARADGVPRPEPKPQRMSDDQVEKVREWARADKARRVRPASRAR